MRFARLALAAGVLAISAAAAAPAAAASWDVVADFAGNANTAASVWQYGYDDHSGAGFTRFTVHSGCITSGLNCWQSTDPQFFVPLVAANTSGSTKNYATTVVQPTDVLNLHPGGGVNGSTVGGNDIDTIVRFTALTAGTYDFSGFFEALDTNPTGVDILAGATPVSIGGFAKVSDLSTGAPTPFGFSLGLAQGGTVDFVVNRRGNYGNDSTGLALSVSQGVPEPATWGLMILGFGGVGAVLRSNRRRGAAAAA